MNTHLTVSGAASELKRLFGLDVHPRDITTCLYLGKLDAEQCPIVSGRRLIPREALPDLAAILQTRRRLPAAAREKVEQN